MMMYRFIPLTLSLLSVLLFSACAREPLDSAVSDETAKEIAVESLDLPSGLGAMAPNLALSNGGVILSWLEPLTDHDASSNTEVDSVALYQAEWRDESWSPPRQIAAGNTFFANWADVPAVVETVDRKRFAHWLSKLGDSTYAYGAELALSDDGGETWSHLGLLHDDASPTEHGFVSYVPLKDGSVQAFWLDGRAMVDEGAMHLRTVRLNDGNAGKSTMLDDRVCECCSTSAALTENGPIVAYRDRGPSEIRDIAVIRAVGQGWSDPTLVSADGWEIYGCPVNGPAIAAAGSHVAVAWFTAASPRPRVSVAFSGDEGASFSAPVVIDDVEPLGRVSVALDASGQALVSWLGTTGEGAEIRWRAVSPEGEMSSVHVVAATTARRASGVPRMVRLEDRLIFVWVEDGEKTLLKAGSVPII